MSKQALIINFEVRTRIVVDIPDGVTTNDFVCDNIEKITEVARQKMIANGVEDYLCVDNMYYERDFECPAKDNDEVSSLA